MLALYAMRLPGVVGGWAVTTFGLATASTGSVCAFGNSNRRDHMLDYEMASPAHALQTGTGESHQVRLIDPMHH